MHSQAAWLFNSYAEGLLRAAGLLILTYRMPYRAVVVVSVAGIDKRCSYGTLSAP
jgi:hypothetical protein